jgi:hypothetical protein
MSDKPMTLEEALSKLAGIPAGKLDFEMADDPDGKLATVFLNGEEDRGPYGGRKRVCIFCKQALVPPDWTSLEIETTDKGKVYVFFCGPHCFGSGAPKIGVVDKIKSIFDLGSKKS